MNPTQFESVNCCVNRFYIRNTDWPTQNVHDKDTGQDCGFKLDLKVKT